MTRPADFAMMGWYPNDRKKCKDQIESFLKKKKPCNSKDIPRIGGLVPHAGWFFSGKLACNIISCLKAKKDPDTVIIFGKHTAPFGNNSIMTSGAWETPLGSIEIDSELAEKISGEIYFEVESEQYYESDNTIEVQLPFIKYHFPGAKILPVGIIKPDAKSIEIGEKIVKIAHKLKREIRIIGSTDMTHYGPNYGFIPKGMGEKALKWVTEINDKRMIDLFLAMKPHKILVEANKSKNCCCSAAVASTISALRIAGAKEGYLIDYYTSYTIHPNHSFVGYAGVIY